MDNLQFTTFIPLYGNKNPNIRYFVSINGRKKELRHDYDNIYYFYKKRLKTLVQITGGLYSKKFTICKIAG